MNGGPVFMVHGIPCVDLPVSPNKSSYSEASLWERAKWSRSLREKKYLKISSPQLLPEDDDNANLIPPPPIEKDERYSWSTVKPRSVQLKVVTSHSQCTVRDVSPLFNMSTAHPNIDPFDSTLSPISSKGKVRYPGVTKIPEDLPCHERYIPLTRSRSTRVLQSQNTQHSPVAGSATDDDDMEADEGWSDSSSIYSQESIEVQITYENYPSYI